MFSFFSALKIKIAAALTAMISFFLPTAYVAPTQLPQTVATSSPPTLTASTTAQVSSATTSKPRATTTIPKKEVPAVKPPASSEIISEPIKNTPVSWDNINEKARAATVNIICTSASGGLFKPISGSGVIIDERGVILVNAHVAQYLLLKNYRTENFIECLIRVGNPARPLYKAELMYISPTWTQAHYRDIQRQNPEGTGENDFALLRITGGSGPTVVLPNQFEYLNIEYVKDTSVVNKPVLIAGYPAGFLGSIAVQTNLFLSSAPATIREVFTFTTSTVDLLSLGGSIVAQQGSSGGAVVNSDGNLLGIIVTTSLSDQTSDRDLRAITLSHIREQLQEEIGVSLEELLARDIAAVAQEFNRDVAPKLSKLYTDLLDRASQ